MFTGIIEEKGTIESLKKTSDSSITMSIHATKVMEDLNIGDSVAVNGICLTVTSCKPHTFQVDVMPETVKGTSLSRLQVQSMVNLERSMRSDSRFGGHFVSGHIDGVGEIISKEQKENAVYFDIDIVNHDSNLIVEKGSIAIDGISLTVFDSQRSVITISLIPHTVAETTLGIKSIGDIVNIEYDMLGKYVQKQLVGKTTGVDKS